jgi:hypothetical protein
VTVEQARQSSGFSLKVAPSVATTPEPSEEELRHLRAIDPVGMVIGKR